MHTVIPSFSSRRVHVPALIPASLLLAAALTGCGGGGSSSAPGPTISAVGVGTPKYGQTLVFTVDGANLDRGLSATSAGCSSVTTGSSAPYASSATRAYLLCQVAAVGDQTLTIGPSSGSGEQTQAGFTVLQPQVTMLVSNGLAVNGSIVYTLDPAKAPITVGNFLKYVNSGFYDQTVFHRVQAGFVVQGGGYAAPIVAGTVPTPKSTNAAIALEVGTGLSNTQWTVAMARGSALNSATSQFFINLANNSALDTASGGYAVFGSVASGTDVVGSMASAPCTTIAGFITSSLGCVPIPNVVITSAVQTR